MTRPYFPAAAFVALALIAGSALAQDLVVDATTVTLGGTQTYDTVQVINGGILQVSNYDGDP